MNIQLTVTETGKDACNPSLSAIDLDVIIDGKTACGVSVVADCFDGSPALYGSSPEFWCSNHNLLADAYTEKAEGMVKYPEDGAVYMAAIELAEADIMTALAELLDTPEAPMYWSGGFWTGE